MVGRGEKTVVETETSEREREREREKDRRSPDETNSKRDVLLIILTPGVRLNERRSQTREARCKFNYREEESGRKGEESEEEERVQDSEGRQSSRKLCVCCEEREREREFVCVCMCVVEKSSSIYMMAVCLDRLLMGRKRVVVIKGTRDSIQWHTERPSRMRLSRLSRTIENTDVFLISDSSVVSSFLVPLILPSFCPRAPPLYSIV